MENRPLQGKRVLELGTMLAAPFAGHLLAELGAEVVKIEPPSGDPTRSLVRGGPSGTFIAYSHGKRSVSLDLGVDEDRRAFDSLLAEADILVHNLSPKSARRLKLTYEDCSALRPGLVYCHIRGYGRGPQGDDLASNPVAEAATGVMEAHRIDGRPSRLGPSYHDQFAGCYGVIGILAAMLAPAPARATHCIEVGLYETGLHVAGRDLAGVQLKTQLLGHPEREPNGEFSMPGYGAYETADNRWIYLLILSDAHWTRFCEALELPEATDESLRRLRDRKKQRDRVESLVRQAVKSVAYDRLAERLTSAGLGHTEVLPLERVLEAPQAREEGKLRHLRFRGLDFEIPKFPVGNLATDTSADPKELGDDTQAVLARAGLPDPDIREILERHAASDAGRRGFAWAPVRK